MTAGLPGTGIGGIFYILITLLMPLHELLSFSRNQWSWSRWKTILLQLSNAGGVLLSLSGGAWLIRNLAESWILPGDSLLRIRSVTAVSFAWLTMAALGTVVMLVLISRFLLYRLSKTAALRS